MMDQITLSVVIKGLWLAQFQAYAVFSYLLCNNATLYHKPYGDNYNALLKSNH